MKPRLGLLGGGWIARSRMAALRAAGKASIAAVADPSATVRSAVAAAAPEAEAVASLEKLLQVELDGLVIATNGLSALQAKVALEQGLPVFCQLPVGRSAKEAANVVEAAERADRLFGTDRRLRYSDPLMRAHDAARGGQLGDIYAAAFELHTSEKRDVRPQVIDALTWILGGQRVQIARSVGGDVRIDFEGGPVADISILTHPNAGPHGFVSFELYGTSGALCFEGPAESVGDPALIDWVEKLASDRRFSSAEVEGVVETAQIIDAIATPARLLSKKTATA